MNNRSAAVIVIVGCLGIMSGCSAHESEAQRHQDANTPAGKMGQVAHKAALQADKAGRAIGRKLDKAAHDAREGWKEDARRDQSER